MIYTIAPGEFSIFVSEDEERESRPCRVGPGECKYSPVMKKGTQCASSSTTDGGFLSIRWKMFSG